MHAAAHVFFNLDDGLRLLRVMGSIFVPFLFFLSAEGCRCFHAPLTQSTSWPAPHPSNLLA